MSDLDEFMNGNADPEKDKGSDLEHFLNTAGHAAAVTGSAVLRGAADAPGYLLDVLGAIGAAGDPMTNIHTTYRGEDTTKTVGRAIGGQGQLTTATDKTVSKAIHALEPRTDLEQWLQAAGMGVGGMAIGGEASLPALVTGVVSGLGGEAAHRTFPNNPVAPAIAALLAGGAVSAGMHGPGVRPDVRPGSDHPDYEALATRVIPALEGGGTYENPKVNSHSGAMGPMQVTPETARDPGYGIRPWDGKSQEDLARVGRDKVAAMLHKYDGDIDKTLAAYNWGEGHVDSAVEKHGDNWFYHAPAETQKYVLDGKMRLGMDFGSTGGPVAPMHPEDIAAAMGQERPAPQYPADPDEGKVISFPEDRIIGEAPEHQLGSSKGFPDLSAYRTKGYDALNNTIDNHLTEAHQVLQDYNDTGEADVSPGQVESYRQGAEDILKGLNKEHPLYDKAQKAVNMWHKVQTEMDEEGIGSKEPIDVMTPQGADKVLAQEPRRVEPANDTSAKDAANREGVYGFGGGEPPKEPPFGGGGHGGEEPPKSPEPEGDKYAGSINLNRMAISNAAKESIKTMAAPMNMSIEAFHETKAKAQELIDKKGIEGVLNQTEVAPEDLAHYATAVRAIHAAAQENMLSLNAEFLDPARNGDVAHARWIHAREVLATAFERNQNIAKGLGRGLGAMRIEVGGEGGNLGEKIADAMKSRQTDEEIAKMIQEHPEQAGKIARDSMKPSASDYIFTTWYAMLLSSGKTLAKNVLSNGLHGTLESGVIYPIAAAIGKLHGGEKVTFHEVGARFSGAMHGTLEGFKNLNDAYKRGTPSDFAERTQSYWKPQNKGVGRVVSAPMRVLAAQDQFFLDVGQNAEYYGLAHRQAFKEGLQPGTPEYADRVIHYLDNPTKKMEASAIEYGKYIRFQDPMEFKGLEYATRATKKDPMMIKVMKGFLRVLFPFPRNSDRMFFAAIRNSPLGVMEPKNLRDFAKGGAMRDVAVARVFAGTMLAGAIYLWASNGGITGANPADPSKKFMVNMGPVHVSYQGLIDPFSTGIAAIATAVEDAKTGGEDLYQKIFKSSLDLTGVLMNSTWATGASQFFQAADDNTGKTMQNWVGRMASSFTTPAIIREINQDYVDPTVRNTKEHPILDNIKAGIPIASNTLPARHDAFGDKITRENPAYLDFINPARIQKDKHPGLSADLADIQSATPLLSKAPKAITIDGEKHQLSARGQERYQAASGKIFTELMENNREQLKSLPNDEKVKLVRQTLSEARKQARQELWGI